MTARVAYVQVGRAGYGDDSFETVNGYAAWRGFKDRGVLVHAFSHSIARIDFSGISLGCDTVVCGNIDVVWRALRKVGVVPPPNIDIPAVLESHAGRSIERTTMGALRKSRIGDTGPFFVKSLRVQEAFRGHVVRRFLDLLETRDMPDDFEVMVQGVVDFESEFRFYVLRGEVIGMAHYRGDPTGLPSPVLVKEMVRAYSLGGAPAAYGLDVGVSTSGRTLLVEVNDAYALGNYGLAPPLYAAMLEARWEEMTAGASG